MTLCWFLPGLAGGSSCILCLLQQQRVQQSEFTTTPISQYIPSLVCHSCIFALFQASERILLLLPIKSLHHVFFPRRPCRGGAGHRLAPVVGQSFWIRRSCHQPGCCSLRSGQGDACPPGSGFGPGVLWLATPFLQELRRHTDADDFFRWCRPIAIGQESPDSRQAGCGALGFKPVHPNKAPCGGLANLLPSLRACATL